VSAAKTIVRQVKGGSDRASHRFVILSETETALRNFTFAPNGVEMTTADVCAALVSQGVSEEDSFTLINEAIASFVHP
jgi:hypothetical protein